MTTPSNTSHGATRRVFSAFVSIIVVVSAVCTRANTAEAAPRQFDLPSADAVVTLKLFAQQSGEEIVYSPEVVRGTRTNAARGGFLPREAIDRMLAGTMLAASETRDGLLSVRRARTRSGRRIAQATSGSTTVNAAPAAPSATEAIEMSPFEVSTTSDEGYAARETLAGTRFKTELKDMPSQISVMTAEFLEDIGTVDVADAFRYSINVENQSEFTAHLNGDFQNGVVDITAGAGNRVRGLGAPGRTHDFFQTFIKDKLAVRVAALKGNDRHWRAPAGQDSERIYGSITIKPFSSTTIRGWYEDATIDRISARNTRVGDSVTPWIEAGRPLFDNSFASPMPNPNASTHPLFSRNTVRTNVLVFGATAADVPMMQWGSTGSSVAAGQPVYSVVTKGPGSEPRPATIHIITVSSTPRSPRTMSRSTAPAHATTSIRKSRASRSNSASARSSSRV